MAEIKYSWKDTVTNIFKDTLACVWKDWIYYIYRILVKKLPSKYSASSLFDQYEAKSLSDKYYVKFHGEMS